jgi:hypothetical protein
MNTPMIPFSVLLEALLAAANIFYFGRIDPKRVVGIDIQKRIHVNPAIAEHFDRSCGSYYWSVSFTGVNDSPVELADTLPAALVALARTMLESCDNPHIVTLRELVGAK